MQIFCNAAINVTTASNGVVLYTAPANQEAVVHNLYISNNSDIDSVKVEVKLVKAGATFTTPATSTPGSFYIVSKNLPIEPLNTIEIKPINLMPGDSIMLKKASNFLASYSGTITDSLRTTTITGLASTETLRAGLVLEEYGTNVGSFGTNATILSIDSPTQITIRSDVNTTNTLGAIAFSVATIPEVHAVASILREIKDF